MVVFVFALPWAGGAVMIWGYCLLRGYNVGFLQLINPFTTFEWTRPMPMASNTVVFPNGSAADSSANSVQTSGSAGGGGTVTGPSQPGNVASQQAIHTAAQQQGWGSGGQWNALTQLIAGESGGDPTARNPSSGALGIAQALGHGTGCSGGTLGNEYGPQFGLTCSQAREANSGDPYQQARWMMGYIKARYQDPVRAYGAWYGRSPHWY